MANRYWVGGSNTWNGTAGSKWSTSSGGSGGASVPGANDVAIFDSNSGSGTVTFGNGYSPTLQGVNTTGFTGSIVPADGSHGRDSTVTIRPTTDSIFTIGSTTDYQLQGLVVFVTPNSSGSKKVTFSGAGGIIVCGALVLDSSYEDLLSVVFSGDLRLGSDEDYAGGYGFTFYPNAYSWAFELANNSTLRVAGLCYAISAASVTFGTNTKIITEPATGTSENAIIAFVGAEEFETVFTGAENLEVYLTRGRYTTTTGHQTGFILVPSYNPIEGFVKVKKFHFGGGVYVVQSMTGLSDPDDEASVVIATSELEIDASNSSSFTGADDPNWPFTTIIFDTYSFVPPSDPPPMWYDGWWFENVNFHKTTPGNVSLDHLNLTNSNATPVVFYAGENSVDGGGNSGWVFSAPPAGVSMPVDTVDYNVGATSVSLEVGRKLPVNVCNFTLTVNEANTPVGKSINVSAVNFQLTPSDLDFTLSRGIKLTPATYSLGVRPASLRFNRLFHIESVATLVGATPVGLYKNFKLLAEATNYQVTTSSLDFERQYRIKPTPLALTTTINNVVLTYTKLFPVEGAEYVTAFNPAGLYKGFALLPDPVEFEVTPTDVQFRKGRTLFVDGPIEVQVSLSDVALTPKVTYEVPTIYLNTKSGAKFYILETIKFNGDPIPASHMEDAVQLNGDGYVDLFQIILAGGGDVIHVKQNSSVSWQGNSYQGTGVMLEGVGNYADEQVSRPKLSLFNPNGVYSSLLDKGLLDFAIIVRYRVLKEHIDNDMPIYRRQQWRVSRIASVRNPAIVLELRDMLDGQNYMTPGRMFTPPDFPLVSLY